ncbi:hypothetical protein C0991_010320 [Blastosporella zonata]|nr:hypothetical protein C0991_010320 [Blastosporella zonata]
MTISIALLISGSIPDTLSPTYGQYLALFTRFLQDSLPDDAQVSFALDPFDVVNKMEYPSDEQLDSYDALMYTGSGSPAANAYEDLPWINRLVAFTARVLRDRPKLKLIGICFGHQIIARALGGSCVPNNGLWEVGPTPLDLTDLGKKIFGVQSVNIQQMHRDHVPSLPPHTGILPESEPLHLLASTSISPNQGMISFFPSPSPLQTLPNTHIFTLQGHPEFVEGLVMGLVALRSASGIMSAEVAADADRRRAWRNDGTGVLGRAVWCVLGVDVA